jgi:hypothetical protein
VIPACELFLPPDPLKLATRPYITVGRGSRGWYAAMIHTGGREIDRLPDNHKHRVDALNEARDWAREFGFKLVTG